MTRTEQKIQRMRRMEWVIGSIRERNTLRSVNGGSGRQWSGLNGKGQQHKLQKV
jgi:hypothetical protein